MLSPEEPQPGHERADTVRLARGGLANLAGAAAFGALGFGLAVMVSRALSPGGTGVFFAFVALYTIAVTVANLGTSVGLMRGISRARALGYVHELRPLLVIGLGPVAICGAVFGALLFVGAPHLAAAFFDQAYAETAETHLRAAAATVPVAAVLLGVLPATRGFGTMLPFNVIENVGQPLLRLLLAIGLFFGLANAWYPALVWAGPSVLALALALPWLARLVTSAEAGVRGARADFRAPLARQFWTFTSARFGAATIEILLAWLGVLLLGALASSESAGVYAAASRYLLAGLLVNAALIGVIGPQLGELLALDDRPRARKLFQTATLWLVLITVPIYLLLAVFAPLFMRAFGPDFAEGADALTILALGMLPSMAAGPIMAVLFMGGRSSWNLLDAAAGLATNALLAVLLIPPFGLVGAAIASAAAVLVLNGLPLFQSYRAWAIHPVGARYAEVLLAAVFCFGLAPLAFRSILGISVMSFVAATLTSFALYVTYVRLRRHAFELPDLGEVGARLLMRRASH